MGLLSCGTSLDWSETKKHAELVKRKGIQEFIHIFKKYKLLKNQPFKWGDEIEFSIVKFDHEAKRAQLLLKSDQIIQSLNEQMLQEDTNIVFHPEYSNYMIETCPYIPFDKSLNCFKSLEGNIKFRRELIESQLDSDEHIMSLTCFPRLGCADFSYPHFKPTPCSGVMQSLFLPDETIFSGHPRFSTITRNIIERTKRKRAMHVPIYVDKFTPRPFREPLEIDDKSLIKDDHIYLDCTGFGMGCCCLQVTFQAESIDEARFLYDQLIPITPIMLALTAAAPIWRGYLANVDARWDVISGSVDDRTNEELGHDSLKNEKFVINKSRYDSIDSYLSEAGERYNDLALVKDSEIYSDLIKSGVDHLLAQHIAHIFIRDPLVLFKEKLDEIINKISSIDNANFEDYDVESFENIQSTNWQTMRFKPPPIKSESNNQIGWRVEFRPMELQLTDFENSAFCSFIILLVNALKKFKMNYLMPITKVDENMKRAQSVNAYIGEKFYFRRNADINQDADCDLVEISIDEIMNGTDGFKGILNVLREYLDTLDEDDEMADNETIQVLRKNLEFIELRASGKLMTDAAYIRKFIFEHSLYKHDSVVSSEINFDLIKHVYQILNKEVNCPQLLMKQN